MDILIPPALKKLAELSPFDIYITGGYLRNAIAGLGETDLDLAGPMVATAIDFPPKKYTVTVVNYRLGTALIQCATGEHFEYTPFRVESYGTGGNHAPVTVAFTSDIRQDALRRDFCCNSLYYNIRTGECIDLFGGKQDAENKILRSFEPERIFADDGLRLLRLVRLAAETGFKIEAATAAAALKNAALLQDISVERKRVELDKILVADTKYGVANAHYRGLKLLKQFGLWQYLIPQLLEGDGMAQNTQYHKYDVLEHSFQTVRFADPSVRLAALLHDVGKPYCQNKFGNMHGHEKSSETMAQSIMGNYGLKYSNAKIEEVSRLCRYHMYDLEGNTSESKMRLFIAKNFDILDKLILLIDADKKGSGLRDITIPHRLVALKQQMLDENTPMDLHALHINGGDLLHVGIRGEAIGILLRDLHEKCVLEPHLNHKEWLLEYAKRHKDKLLNIDE